MIDVMEKRIQRQVMALLMSEFGSDRPRIVEMVGGIEAFQNELDRKLYFGERKREAERTKRTLT